MIDRVFERLTDFAAIVGKSSFSLKNLTEYAFSLTQSLSLHCFARIRKPFVSGYPLRRFAYR